MSSQSSTDTVADAIVSALNGRTWSPTFTAKRWTEPRHTELELATLQVSVVGRGRATQIETRGADRKTHTVWICVQKLVSDVNAKAVVDPLAKLVEDIEDFLLGQQFAGATCLEINPVLADDRLIAPEHLLRNVFTAAFTLTLVQ